MIRYNTGIIVLYDLQSRSIIGSYNLASYNSNNHANSASFSNTMGTKYPLIYISECYGDHRCFVEDIGDSSSELIQTISYANDANDYEATAWDWILDKYSNRIMTLGVKNNKKLRKVFSLPNVENESVTLMDGDKIEEWFADDSAGETLNTYQGNTVIGNTLYLPISNTERLFAFDKTTHALLGKIDISSDMPSLREVEDIDIYKKDLIVSTNSNIYLRISFT